MNINNLTILDMMDSYKQSMWEQLPEGTDYLFTYIESRGGHYDKLVMFGLQAFIKQYLLRPLTAQDVVDAQLNAEAHGEPFNFDGWMYIVEKHGGLLPIHIRAVPEGTVVDNKNVLLTLVNTDKNCAFVTDTLETALLRAIWYPTQVATTSYRIRNLIEWYMKNTGCDVEANIKFALNDFGARGCSSTETSMLGGMSHLLSFMGSDTMTALRGAQWFYDEPMAGYSIAASQHSTMTCRGRDGEVEQMRNMIKKFGKRGIFACVSDGFDIYNACQNIWGGVLKQEVLDSGARLVVRPDSGDPVSVTLKVIQILGEKFGFTNNAAGFKVLHPQVRVIQGDGVNEHSIELILSNLMAHGWAAENICFGMGGALLQNHTRDDNKWAMKCSAIRINGVWSDVYKDPITDKGKLSKKGVLDLYKEEGKYKTVRVEQNDFTEIQYCVRSELKTIFMNGRLVTDESFATIRNRLWRKNEN